MQNLQDKYSDLSNSTRIEICGGIASGKTTFANLIKNKGMEAILENFRINPFWEAFYVNPAKYTFETEISFMLQHYHQIKSDSLPNKLKVCDYSFFLDVAYAEIGLQGTKLQAFIAVYEEIKKELPPPILLIHLHCDAQTELERIRKRARQEENSITLEFLDSLNKAVEHQVENIRDKINVITIDSTAKNFAEDEAIKHEMQELLSKALKDRTEFCCNGL